jgi:hypothetical protein
MIRRDRTQERLIALFLLGVLVLTPPLLLVFNQPIRVLGIPILYLYLFLAWTVLIGAAAVVARGIAAADVDSDGNRYPSSQARQRTRDA